MKIYHGVLYKKVLLKIIYYLHIINKLNSIKFEEGTYFELAAVFGLVDNLKFSDAGNSFNFIFFFFLVSTNISMQNLYKSCRSC